MAVSLPVPLDMKHTINSAGLLAAVQALHLHSHSPKVAIVQTPRMSFWVQKGRLNIGKQGGGCGPLDLSAMSPCGRNYSVFQMTLFTTSCGLKLAR